VEVRAAESVPGQFSFVPLDIGARQGIFAKYGVDITITSFTGDAKLQEGMASNSIDIGLGGGPAMAFSAISIGGLSVFIKGGTFFIPGSLGAQDGGNLLLLKAFGYSDVTGITFALLRRFRELVWIGIGLLCLALIGGLPAVSQKQPTHESGQSS